MLLIAFVLVKSKYKSLPNGSHKIKQDKTMNILKKPIKANEVEIMDTLMYLRVIVLQITKEALNTENVLKFKELAPIPSSIFDIGSLRPLKSRSALKNIETKLLVQKSEKLNFVVIDSYAVLYIVNWPTKPLT